MFFYVDHAYQITCMSINVRPWYLFVRLFGSLIRLQLSMVISRVVMMVKFMIPESRNPTPIILPKYRFSFFLHLRAIVGEKLASFITTADLSLYSTAR